MISHTELIVSESKVDNWKDGGGENEGENICARHEVGAGEEGNGPFIRDAIIKDQLG
jgi:hypothetical protein